LKKPDEAKNEKKASAKKARVEKEEDSATSYMVRSYLKEEGQKNVEEPGGEADESNIEVPVFMANSKRKKTETPEVEVEKKAKTRVKNVAKKTVDSEIVEMFKKMPVPLELVVRHGASFEAQAKRAIKKVYAEGREYRRRVNPLVNVKSSLDMDVKLSHAMVVSGMLGKIPCERLVIDPGCSISMIDIRTARKGPIPIKKESQLTFHLANGVVEKPVGETLE
jgi:hypothetical protein